MSCYELIMTTISILTFCVLIFVYIKQFSQYKKENRINALSSLLNSAQTVSYRLSFSEEEEKKDLNSKIAKSLPKYYEELMELVSK